MSAEGFFLCIPPGLKEIIAETLNMVLCTPCNLEMAYQSNTTVLLEHLK